MPLRSGSKRTEQQQSDFVLTVIVAGSTTEPGVFSELLQNPQGPSTVLMIQSRRFIKHIRLGVDAVFADELPHCVDVGY